MRLRGKLRSAAAGIGIFLGMSGMVLGMTGCSLELSQVRTQIRQSMETDAQQPEKVEAASTEHYAYQTLSGEEQNVYDQIVYAIVHREEKRKLSTTSVAVMKKAYQAVRSDYCNFFWLKKLSYVTYTKGKQVKNIEVTPEYAMSEKRQAEIQKKIDAQAAQMLKDAPKDGSDFEKALYVYETLIREVDYDRNVKNNQNIISVFLEHRTICQGYAYATQYLLEQLGIPTATVTGEAEGEKHAWNLIRLDGAYYYMDTTWGNSQYMTQNSSRTGKYTDYSCFAMTTKELEKTHTIDRGIVFPECTQTADDYYIHQGRYFSKWKEKEIGTIVGKAWKSGEGQVQIRFSDNKLLKQALRYFITDGHLADYCKGIRTIRYMQNKDSQILIFRFE